MLVLTMKQWQAMSKKMKKQAVDLAIASKIDSYLLVMIAQFNDPVANRVPRNRLV